MANRKVPSVRPPRKPRGEDPKVTIATLKRLNDQFIVRIMDLVKERDEAIIQSTRAASLAEKYQAESSRLQSGVDRQRNEIEGLKAAMSRIQGWKDCARELIESLTLSKP